MKLKAYTLTGPAKFSATPIVWIQLQCTKDTFGLARELLTFMIDNEICAVVGASSGGGAFSAGFTQEDADVIVGWLKR